MRPFVPPGSETSSADRGPGGKWQISRDGAIAATPRWRSDGKELLFIGGFQVMAVDVNLIPVFRSGNPQPLFRLPVGSVVQFAVAADGKKILAAVPAQASEVAEPMTVVLNWTALLKP